MAYDAQPPAKPARAPRSPAALVYLAQATKARRFAASARERARREGPIMAEALERHADDLRDEARECIALARGAV